MNDDETIEMWARIGNVIIKKLLAVDKRDDAVAACHTLMRRLVNSGSTLRVLFDNANDHDWTADGASILRTSYDASLQALYILADPKERQQRARRFIDFSIIEQVKLIELADERRTAASRQIADSKRRAAIEPTIRSEFNRVSKLYGYDKMKKPPVNWYKGSLRDVAKGAGYETEYVLIHKQLSGAVHSSFFGLTYSGAFKGFNAIQLYWLFAFRVLRKLADYLEVELTDAEKKILELADRNVLDGHA
jgi:hypothetical protein